jgi:hypothetical protein
MIELLRLRFDKLLVSLFDILGDGGLGLGSIFGSALGCLHGGRSLGLGCGRRLRGGTLRVRETSLLLETLDSVPQGANGAVFSKQSVKLSLQNDTKRGFFEKKRSRRILALTHKLGEFFKVDGRIAGSNDPNEELKLSVPYIRTHCRENVRLKRGRG